MRFDTTPREGGSLVRDVLPHIGMPCKVVSAPITMLPQSINTRNLRFVSCVKEVGSFCIFSHLSILNELSCNNRPIELGSFLRRQHPKMFRVSKFVSATKVLGNFFKFSQRDSLRCLSILRSSSEFGRHCSLSHLMSNSVSFTKSPMDYGNSVRVLSST